LRFGGTTEFGAFLWTKIGNKPPYCGYRPSCPRRDEARRLGEVDRQPTRLASSLVSRFAAERQRLTVLVADDETGVYLVNGPRRRSFRDTRFETWPESARI